MKAESFAYWLQGFFELTNVEKIDEKQTQIIKNHLNLVFVHDIDPKMGDEAHQEKLNEIHTPPKYVEFGSDFNKSNDGSIIRC